MYLLLKLRFVILTSSQITQNVLYSSFAGISANCRAMQSWKNTSNRIERRSPRIRYFQTSCCAKYSCTTPNIPSSKVLNLLQCCPFLKRCHFLCIEPRDLFVLQSSIVCLHMQSLKTDLKGAVGIFLFPWLTHLKLDWPQNPRLVAVVIHMSVPAGDMEVIPREVRRFEFLNLSLWTLSSSALEIMSHGKCVTMLKTLLYAEVSPRTNILIF
jgi:hypothetical protein